MKRRVLFLCTGNSCRSQMAEGFLRNLGGGSFSVFSAGISPGSVNPLSVKAMAEVGIDISGQISKSVHSMINERFDVIITVCDNAKQTCPVFPGEARKLHWDLEDPAGAQGTEEERMKVFRAIRDRIKKNVTKFIEMENRRR